MTWKHCNSRQQLSACDRSLAEHFAFAYGRSYDSYLLLDEGREYFFGPDDCGVVAFARWRKTAFVIGGLLAPESRRAQLLASFLEFTTANGIEPLFFNVLAEDLPLFRSHGLLVSKTGEEPVIDLRAVRWTGKPYAWVRRQANLCVRQEVHVREVSVDPMSRTYRNEVVPQIRDVSAQHLNATVYGRELRLMVGQLDPLEMYRRRLFVGERNGRIEAFLVVTPGYNGKYWAIETYRRRPDAPTGIIATMFLHVARQLQTEDVPVLSLCQIPGLRSDHTDYDQSQLVSSSMRIWWHWLGWFYDPVRLYHFKSRFRPAYRECFLVGRNPKFLPMLAFAFKWGVIWPDFKRLPRQMLRRIKKWTHASGLADPLAEGHQIVERLETESASPLVLASSPVGPESYESKSAESARALPPRVRRMRSVST